MNVHDPKHRNKLTSILASRKPVVSVRLTRQGRDGVVKAEMLGEGWDGKASQLKTLVERIFRAGRLTNHEWECLFSLTKPQSAAARWPLLVRLAIRPTTDEAVFRDRFVSLPDGTPFSMRLLIRDERGGSRNSPLRRAPEVISGLPFSRLPNVVKLILLNEALQEEQRDGRFRTDKELGRLISTMAARHDLQLDEGDLDKAVDRLRQILVRNGGESVLPNRKVRKSQSTAAALRPVGREGRA